jgi:hypothetical protein
VLSTGNTKISLVPHQASYLTFFRCTLPSLIQFVFLRPGVYRCTRCQLMRLDRPYEKSAVLYCLRAQQSGPAAIGYICSEVCAPRDPPPMGDSFNG